MEIRRVATSRPGSVGSDPTIARVNTCRLHVETRTKENARRAQCQILCSRCSHVGWLRRSGKSIRAAALALTLHCGMTAQRWLQLKDDKAPQPLLYRSPCSFQ